MCFWCSRLNVTDAEAAAVPNTLDGKWRFAHVQGICSKRKKCVHCQSPQPHYTRGVLDIKTDWPGATLADEDEIRYCARPFTSRHAQSILECVPRNDLRVMGFERTSPRAFVLDVLPVIPPVARPSVLASEGSRSRGHDDITMRLLDILRRCSELRVHLKRCSVDVTPVLDDDAEIDVEALEALHRLQSEVFAYVNSNERANPRGGRGGGGAASYKSLGDRLRGKEGRIRANLMGKRVNYSARAVISADTSIDADEVGVPRSVALVLVVQERVTTANIAALSYRVRLGPGRVDGAESIITDTGALVLLEFCASRATICLQIGWVVQRPLCDGDPVIFNRQPSLHKAGMMQHRAKIVDQQTFRMNLSVTPCYNADFDGDEMNLHLPVSAAAAFESQTLMSVPAQVLSAASNRPCIASVQDALVGAYLMTRDDVLLTRSQAMRLIVEIRHPRKPWWELLPLPGIVWPRVRWTGRQMISLLFPPTLQYVRGDIAVRDGVLLSGTLNKSTMGTSSGGIVDTISREFGALTVQFVSDLQRVVNRFLMWRGFNVGIWDCVPTDNGRARTRDCVDAAASNVKAIFDRGVPSSRLVQVEGVVQRILSRTLMNVATAVFEEMSYNNAIKCMVNAGSKGNMVNVAQVCGIVGQQTVEGGRVCANVPRPLSHFSNPHDMNAVGTRGFVHNSYFDGLNPSEQLYHAMGGREGLVDTSCKTATTGYLQRRLVKAMEDLVSAYDGTVRNADGAIVQFVYGTDGYDGSLLERFTVPAIDWDEAAFARAIDDFTPRGAAQLARARELRNAVFEQRKVLDDCVSTQVLAPINPLRKLDTMLPASEEDVCSAETATQLVDTLLHRIDPRDAPLRLIVAVYLSTHQVCAVRRLSRTDVCKLCDLIARRHEQARLTPGATVGCLAAQSIGEPATQLTLNTFHLAGCGNQLGGVPYFKAIIDLSHIPGTVRLRLHEPHASDEALATQLAHSLVQTSLVDIVLHTEMLLGNDRDSARSDAASEADGIMLRLDALFVEECQPRLGASAARMTLNRDLMRERCITPPHVRQVLEDAFAGRAHICSSEVNALEWTLRVQNIIVDDAMEIDDATDHVVLQRIHAEMLKTLLSGISGITHAACQKVEVSLAPGVTTTQCIVEASGAAQITKFLHRPEINVYESSFNNLHDVHELFGIEACTATLYHEVRKAIGADGTHVDSRHYAQVADTMSFRGTLTSFTRHGINRFHQGPLLRASFEETLDNIGDAAMFNESDSGAGVTQAVILGQMARIGSGLCSVRARKTEPVAPQASMLCKSRVRRRIDNNVSTDAENLAPRIEYTDGSTWSTLGNGWSSTVVSNFYHPPSP